jgi:hypothetical protein
MKATLEHSELKQKFGRVLSSRHQCTKTSVNSLENVEDARCMVALQLAMPCPSPTISKSSSLTSGALTSWDSFKSLMTASTSWLLWITYPSDLQ